MGCLQRDFLILKGQGRYMFLEINELKKSFGSGDYKVDVLKGISFGVEKGEMCVLLQD